MKIRYWIFLKKGSKSDTRFTVIFLLKGLSGNDSHTSLSFHKKKMANDNHLSLHIYVTVLISNYYNDFCEIGHRKTTLAAMV